MNTIHDILLVEDSQNDIDLALYALREERLANSIFVVRDGKEALDFLFCRGVFCGPMEIVEPWQFRFVIPEENFRERFAGRTHRQ